MKNLFLLLLFSLIALVGNAQDDETNTNLDKEVKTDTLPNQEEDADVKFSISLEGKNKMVKTRFVLLDLGINSYHNQGQLNIPASLETFQLRHGSSIEVNFHIYRQRIGIGKRYFNIEHGLSFDFNHYAFQNPVEYQADPVNEFYFDANSPIQRSRLFVSRMMIPLMLHFETNPQKLSRSFHFGVGGYGSVRLGTNLRTKVSRKDKNKVADDFGLNDFAFGARAEMGFGPVNLYIKYAFTDLFKIGQGPNITPFSIGFTVIPF